MFGVVGGQIVDVDEVDVQFLFSDWDFFDFPENALRDLVEDQLVLDLVGVVGDSLKQNLAFVVLAFLEVFLKQANHFQLALLVLLVNHQLHPQLQIEIELNLVLNYLQRLTVERTVQRPVVHDVGIPPGNKPE